MMRRDPQELDPHFRKVVEDVMAEVEAGLDPLYRKMGACHIIWRETKQILKQRHNLDWQTPAEMNPDIIFD